METSPIAVGPIIRRYDGRFYIPIVRTQHDNKHDKRSIVMARIASDAFHDEESAMDFGKKLVELWNLTISERLVEAPFTNHS